nr:MAG TPA: hypothetical protein [Caudoviricetes sp.]
MLFYHFPWSFLYINRTYRKNLDFFQPSATIISQGHPGRKIIFSHRNNLVIFPSIRKKQDASDKGDVLLFIIFYKL